jgi:hypothetical protein
LIEDHDLTVDYIVTPLEIIKCNTSGKKPAGIIWSKLEPGKVSSVNKILTGESCFVQVFFSPPLEWRYEPHWGC